MLKNIKDSSKTILLLLSAALIIALDFFLVRKLPTLVDEIVHYYQVLLIVSGKDFLPHICPYLPGYHWSMAVLCWPTGITTLSAMRMLTSCISFFCFLSFFFLGKKIDKDSAFQKSFLFLIFPLFLPFFSLVYTDMYAMLFVFAPLLLALNQRLWLAGIAGILGLFVRQNNIIWVVMIAFISYFDNDYPRLPWKDWRRLGSKYFFFFLAVILFIVFIIWNKGVVFGDRLHHILAFSTGNVFLCLFMFFFLFLPYNLSNAAKIFTLLKEKKAAGVMLVPVFLIYILFFKSNHSYNQSPHFLHHYILWQMASPFLPVKILTFLPIAYSILSLWVTRLQRKSFYLLYPFSILAMLPLAVIEIRYFFIPLALFMLFKEKDSKSIALCTFFIYLPAACWIMSLLISRSFFP